MTSLACDVNPLIGNVNVYMGCNHIRAVLPEDGILTVSLLGTSKEMLKNTDILLDNYLRSSCFYV